MYYFTFADQPSGVLSSQAIDVCRFLNQNAGVRVQMVLFVSIRQYGNSRRRIKIEMPDAIVLPMIPKISTWRWNAITLFFLLLFRRKEAVIARGVLATQLAFMLKRCGQFTKVAFDSRGAYAAELNEYNVTDNLKLKNAIRGLEENCVRKADFRLAVSEMLVKYWRTEFNYNGLGHVVIPCLLSTGVKIEPASAGDRNSIRLKLGFKETDLVFIYSGSTAGWQSFNLLEIIMQTLLSNSPQTNVLFMSDADKQIETLKERFPQQVKRILVKHNEVNAYLKCGDYGLMIREQSVTNRVAAPTKFAEYLAAGLSVVVSENLGDYSRFVLEHKCGVVISENNNAYDLKQLTEQDRNRNLNLARKYFTKQAHLADYTTLLKSLES